MCRMKSATSVGPHQVQGVYKWSSSTSWTEMYEQGKGGISNTRPDQITVGMRFQLGGQSLA